VPVVKTRKRCLAEKPPDLLMSMDNSRSRSSKQAGEGGRGAAVPVMETRSGCLARPSRLAREHGQPRIDYSSQGRWKEARGWRCGCWRPGSGCSARSIPTRSRT